ncbi:nuclear transport factor 2 family protein [Nocardia colli]|uniref:nuclear transport factor 2 family protein n=1 Tax=Nocardia colli TaxID=2545717 RepID=UPI0035D6C748
MDAVFAPDARLFTPAGEPIVGRDAIAASQPRLLEIFTSTHHMITEPLLDLDGDRVRVRANMIAMHMWSADYADSLGLESHFQAGGVFDGVAVRTEEGWSAGAFAEVGWLDRMLLWPWGSSAQDRSIRDVAVPG